MCWYNVMKNIYLYTHKNTCSFSQIKKKSHERVLRYCCDSYLMCLSWKSVILCSDIRILFVYLSHSLAPGCRWEVPALRNPSSSIWPGTENGADPAGAVQSSLVMRKSQKSQKPGISVPLSVPGGSPEPCPQRWSACLWTAPPPVG